jgi:hypothetical protein
MILTGEFPPGSGGVGDYTAQVAAALAEAGDGVAVFRPPASSEPVAAAGVEVVTLRDHYGPLARGQLGRRLDDVRARVLVQYVPQAFGVRGANVSFCRWLRRRFVRGDDIRVMFHEPYFYLSLNPTHAALAAFQRAMAAILLRSSNRIYLSTAAWQPYLKRYAPRRFSPVVLPIPSAIPSVNRPECVAAVRGRVLNDGASRLIGHFGTYGDHIAPLVKKTFLSVLRRDASVAALCIGARSYEFARDLASSAPELEQRIHATGRMPADEVSVQLQSCDVLVQPYPDGVTTRRTSVMAALVNGRPVVTTDGDLTESVWRESSAAALVPAADTDAMVSAVRRLAGDAAARASLGARASATYAQHFALERTIAALRDAVPDSP